MPWHIAHFVLNSSCACSMAMLFSDEFFGPVSGIAGPPVDGGGGLSPLPQPTVVIAARTSAMNRRCMPRCTCAARSTQSLVGILARPRALHGRTVDPEVDLVLRRRAVAVEVTDGPQDRG